MICSLDATRTASASGSDRRRSDSIRAGSAMRESVTTRLDISSFTSSRGRCSKASILPLGVVEAIVGQSRLDVVFEGQANHAGTTPMHLRRDALAGAAEWIAAVEREARAIPGAVATVGRVEASPGASNVIPGTVTAESRRSACR